MVVSSPAPGSPRPAAVGSATTAGLLAHGSNAADPCLPEPLPAQWLAAPKAKRPTRSEWLNGSPLTVAGAAADLPPDHTQPSQDARRSLFTRSRGTIDKANLTQHRVDIKGRASSLQRGRGLASATLRGWASQPLGRARRTRLARRSSLRTRPERAGRDPVQRSPATGHHRHLASGLLGVRAAPGRPIPRRESAPTPVRPL